MFKNLFKWFASGPDAAKTVLDAGIAGVDALVYTDEERATAHQKLLDNWIELQKAMGEETSVRGITRRLLTFMTVLPFTLIVCAAAVVHAFDPAYAQFLLSLAESNFGYIVLTIVVFYFGPLVGRIFKNG
jgi:hypothetical protein